MKQLYYAAGAAVAVLENHRPFGSNIYERDWDLCIILDSTRVDMMRQLLPVNFAGWPETPEIETDWSVGSVTTEWLANTFRPEYAEEISETGLVSATPHTQTVFEDRDYLTNSDDVWVPYPEANAVSPDVFDGYHELWRTHADTEHVVPPETMRDATLEATEKYDRVVAHWMQPHEPFIAPDAAVTGARATSERLWTMMEFYDAETVWQSYCANLSYALKHVRTVVENVDGTVLITSDHGNAFGEWGIYGHPFAWPQPEVRKVPWVLIDAMDFGDYDYASVLNADSEHVTRDEQLRALGYK